MRIAVAADERTGIADALAEELRKRGHEPIPHGALNDDERDDWAWASEAAARDVAEGRADQGIVCCWTGTGASIAANKVPGIRAALCGDAETAEGARKWNDANVLALSLRTTSAGAAERDPRRLVRGRAVVRRGRHANVRHLDESAKGRRSRPRQPRPEASSPSKRGHGWPQEVEAGRRSRRRPAVDATESRHAGHP